MWSIVHSMRHHDLPISLDYHVNLAQDSLLELEHIADAVNEQWFLTNQLDFYCGHDHLRLHVAHL